MGLIRLIAIAFIIWLVIYIARQLLQKHGQSPGKKPAMKIGTMVRCEHCGLHIPENEAINENGHYYCCEEHRKKL